MLNDSEKQILSLNGPFVTDYSLRLEQSLVNKALSESHLYSEADQPQNNLDADS